MSWILFVDKPGGRGEGGGSINEFNVFHCNENEWLRLLWVSTMKFCIKKKKNKN